MTLAWMTIAGLVLDFCGFALIAWEWLIAQRQERDERAIAESRARETASTDLMRRGASQPNLQMERHFEQVERMRQQQAQQRTAQVRQGYSTMRFRVVYAGMAMVALGFLLQLGGAWPAGVWPLAP